MSKISLSNFFYVIAITFPLVILYEIFVYGSHVPVHDYWDNMTLMLRYEGKVDLLSLQNEHIQAVARIIYYVNMHLFDGHDLPLKLVSFVFAALQIPMIYSIARKYITCDFKRSLCFFIITSYCFTPFAIENFIAGMSGTVWLSTNFFVIAAFYSFYNRNQRPYLYKLTFVMSCIFASLSHSTGFFILPSLAVAYLLAYRPSLKVSLAILSTSCILVLAYILFFFEVPEQHVETYNMGLLDNLLPKILSIVLMSGMAISYVIFAPILACVILYNLARTSLRVHKIKEASEKENKIFFIAIAVYSLAFISSCSFARYDIVFMGFVDDSRYQSLPALLLIASFIMFIKNVKIQPDSKKYIISLCVLALTAVTFGRGFAKVELFRSIHEISNLNSYSLLLNESFVFSVYNKPEFKAPVSEKKDFIEKNSVKYLRNYKNVPFNESYWNKCDRAIKEGIESDVQNSESMFNWGYSKLDSPGWDHSFVQIYMLENKTDTECVLITDAQNQIVGAGFPSKTFTHEYVKVADEYHKYPLLRAFIVARDDDFYKDYYVISYNQRTGKAIRYNLSAEPLAEVEDKGR